MSKTRKTLLVLLASILLAGISAGAYWYLYGERPPEDRLKLFGNIEIRQIHLAFESSGRIRAIRVNEGDSVKAGQLLAALDPSRYEAALEQARAEEAAQRRVLSRLLRGSRPEEIAAGKARVKSAAATLREARENFRRSRVLAETRYVSQQQLDNRKAALESAEAALEAERQNLQLLVKGPREEDIQKARALLQARGAALALARDRLTDTRLHAPAAGVIRERILEPGDMAFPSKPVLALALTSPLWVRAYISEPDLGKIAPGMPAGVTTDSFPEKTYAGWVGHIAPTAEFTPKQVQTTELRSKLVYQVRVYVCDPQNELRLGMPATVVVDLGARTGSGKTPGTDRCRGD